jgi:hypothetical protein
MRWLKEILTALLVTAFLPIQAMGGTTGAVSGRVVDADSHAPIAGVVVTARAPSQVATTITDAGGTFHFLSLAPDTYVLSFSKPPYNALSQSGISVFADQVQTVDVKMVNLRTIARVT